MPKFKRVCLLFVLVILSGESFAQNIAQTKPCEVYGAVLDNQFAVIPSGTVTFKSSHSEKSAEVDDGGGYRFLLEAGVYEISYSVKYDLYLYKRAKLDVNCAKDLNINIYPFPKRVSYGDESPEHKFENIKLLSPKIDFGVIAAYISKRTRNGVLIYTRSTLTYNNVTISARKITVDLKKKTVVAEEGAWAEDGKRRSKTNRISLAFADNDLKIVD